MASLYEKYDQLNHNLDLLGANRNGSDKSPKNYGIKSEKEFYGVYDSLENDNKSKLEFLMDRYLNVTNVIREDTLNFNILKIEEAKLTSLSVAPDGFAVYFTDNINGATRYVTRCSIEERENSSGRLFDGAPDDFNNKEFDAICTCYKKVILGLSGNWGFNGYIGRDCDQFKPQTYVHNLGFVMYVKDNGEAVDGIKRFKRLVRTKFIKSNHTPIRSMIEWIIDSGHYSYEQSLKNADHKRNSDEIRDLVGKKI